MYIPLGLPRSLQLTNIPCRLIVKDNRANGLLIQAQGGDVSYRLDGDMNPVTGFILPQNQLLTVTGNYPVSVWRTEMLGEVRLVIQDIKLS